MITTTTTNDNNNIHNSKRTVHATTTTTTTNHSHNNINTHVVQTSITTSPGQVALARALLREPELLLLDPMLCYVIL